MKKIWSIISTVVLIVVILLLIAFGGVRLIGLMPYMVTSGSMEPEYPVGSLIYVKETPVQDISVGDAITFYLEDGRTVATHQVYEVDEEEQVFRTQGINNRDSDGNILHDASPVEFSSVIGCPVAVIPYLGYLNRFCTTAPGVYILIAAAVAVLLISIFVDSREGKEEAHRRRTTRRNKHSRSRHHRKQR